MTNYHVRITLPDQKHDETKIDLDAEGLERQFLKPYREGLPITVNGKTIAPTEVSRIRVSSSEEPSSSIISQLRYEDQNSNVISLGGPGYAWRAAARAEDVTDQFITGPPGGSAGAQHLVVGGDPDPAVSPTTDSRLDPERGPADTVFVVAGRDNGAISAVVAFLRALGLRIVEWEQAVARTGLPNPYVGDVVDAGLRMAGAAVVILSPDDLVRLREDLLRDDDGPDERDIRGQARPNVYYEAGIADALGRERTILVEVGTVKSFSDALGRHILRYDGSPAKRHAFAQRLGVAGLTVDTGGQDWLTAGDVSRAISVAQDVLGGLQDTQTSIVDKTALRTQIEAVLLLHDELKTASVYDDFSDLPGESLDFVLRAQSIIDRLPADSTAAFEVRAVRAAEPHERIPVLYAALRTVHAELGA